VGIFLIFKVQSQLKAVLMLMVPFKRARVPPLGIRLQTKRRELHGE